MDHHALIYDTKLLNIPGNLPQATKIIDVSSQIQVEPSKVISDQQGRSLSFTGNLLFRFFMKIKHQNQR